MSSDQTKILSFGSSSSTDSGQSPVFVIDPDKNKDESGNVKSEFVKGEQIYLLLHLGPKIALVRMLETTGGLVKIGTVTRKNTVDISLGYAGATLDLPHYPTGNVTVTWYGRSANVTVDDRTVKVSAGPVRGVISYSYKAVQYLYKPPAAMVIPASGVFPAVAWAETKKVG